MIVLGGGKGGVGTSTAAALLALAAARRGVDTLLVEAVHTVSSLPLLFDLPPGLPGLLTRGGPTDLAELEVTPRPHLTLLPGGGEAVELPGTRTAERGALVRRASSSYERHALTLVDAGSRLEEVLGAVSAGLERLVVVASPDRVAAAGGYALAKAVRHHRGDVPVEWLVSRADEGRADACHAVAAEAAANFLGVELPLSGWLPDDPAVPAVLGAARPLHDLEGDAPSLAAADRIVARWLERRTDGGSDARVIPLRRR